MDSNVKTDFQAALDAGMMIRELAGEDGCQFTVIPMGAQVVDLERYLPAPRRLAQRINFEDLASFVTYVKTFKQDSTTILCCPKEHTFTAILDYHKAPDAPAWGSHVAVLKMQTTEEWDVWRGGNRKVMDQTTFAEFIENQYRDIHRPPAADMLEIALNFEAKKDVTFSSGMRLQSGQVQFTYNEVVGASTRAGTVEVPATFTIFIGIFKGQMNDFIEARLRYRLKDHKLVLWYELNKPEKLVEAAVENVMRTIRLDAGIEPLVGSIQGAQK